MKKWIISIALLIIAALVVLIVALPFVLPLEKIKDFAAAKMEETLEREVKIGDVSFNIFSGIKLKDLYIGNRKGFSREAFVTASAIELRYAFWPLLRLQLMVEKINLVKPRILIERKAGEYNFSDLIARLRQDFGGQARLPKIQRRQAKKPKGEKKARGKPPITFLISRLSVSKGQLTFIDHTPAGLKKRGFSDVNIDIAPLSLTGDRPMSIKVKGTGLYEGKPIPLGLSGRVTLDLDGNYIKISNLSANVAGEKILAKAEVSNFRTAPQINFSLTADKLALDPFLAILSGREKPAEPRVYGETTRSINRTLKTLPANLVMKGTIEINNLKLRKLKITDIKLSTSMRKKVLTLNIKEIKAYQGQLSAKGQANLNIPGIAYSLDNLELKNFNATPFTNDLVDSFLTELEKSEELKNKVEGRLELKGSLRGSGVEIPDILANLKGSGALLLTNGRIKHLKSLEEIADKLSIGLLKQDLIIKELKANFSVGNKILNIKDLLAHNDPVGDARVAFKGGVNLDKLEYVPGNELTLSLHPRVTKDLPPEYDYFKDEKGWTAIEFELKGSLKKPIPIPKLGKALERAIEKKKKEEIEKVEKEIEKKKEELKEEVEKKVEELKKEAEEKLKELIKF